MRNKIKNYYKNKLTKIITRIFNLYNTKERKIFHQNYLFYRRYYLSQKNKLTEKSIRFLVSTWADHAKKIEDYFLNSFTINFFSHPVIMNTMFIKSKWENLQLAYLETRYKNKELKKILYEEKFGCPTIASWKYRSSPNSIHHLNHLSLFEDKTKCSLKKIKNVIEWGGGYGNMARIFYRIKPNTTYTIIDMPIFIFIQAIYLSSIFGRNKINIITEPNQKIKNNFINLITLNEELLKNINFNRPDVFISTWGLSESNDFSQNIVERLNYFGSRYLLIGHQASSFTMPFAEDILKKIDKFEIVYHKKIPYIRGGNYYLFAKHYLTQKDKSYQQKNYNYYEFKNKKFD